MKLEERVEELSRLGKEKLIQYILDMEEYINELREKETLGKRDDAIYYGETAVVTELLKERYSELKSNFDKNEYQALSFIAWLAEVFDSTFLKETHDFILKHKRGHKGFTMDSAIRFVKGLAGTLEPEEKPSWRERIARKLRGGE